MGMTRIVKISTIATLTALSACGFGGDSQNFGASLSGLNSLQPSAARTIPGVLLDQSGGWEWFGNEYRLEPCHGLGTAPDPDACPPNGVSLVGGDNEYPNQALRRRIQNGPDGEYVQHYVDNAASGNRHLTTTTGTVVYSGAADTAGNSTNMPAALGTTCVGASCDYWQSDDVTLTADLDNGTAHLAVTEIVNRTDDERYRPDGRRLDFYGWISGTEIRSNHSEVDAHLGLLNGNLGEDHATGEFSQWTNYEGPRTRIAELLLRLAGEGPIPPQLEKEHWGVFSVLREPGN